MWPKLRRCARDLPVLLKCWPCAVLAIVFSRQWGRDGCNKMRRAIYARADDAGDTWAVRICDCYAITKNWEEKSQRRCCKDFERDTDLVKSKPITLFHLSSSLRAAPTLLMRMPCKALAVAASVAMRWGDICQSRRDLYAYRQR
jgi:hypothetical protein